MTANTKGTASTIDPRLGLKEAQHHALSLRAMPMVARPHRAGEDIGLVLGLLGALGLGAITLIGLSNQRTRTPAASVPVATIAPSPASTVSASPTPTAPPPAKPTAEITSKVSNTPAPAQVDPGQSRSMPMIIDNTGSMAADTAPAGKTGAPGGNAAANGMNPDELFAMRAASDAPPLAQATALGDRRHTIVQGTVIPAVLETALNSDLPGYARAIVSRDVHGFDGSSVLIPRGSRVVGQYKSSLQAGQSRAYIMWTRLIRPDGISVQLGSPAMDEGGEIGLPGDVKRHFWQRFGSSILLSVVSGLASAVGDGNSVVIASGGTQGAAGVALETDGKIPPTIRVPLGTPIQIFVARDLDFSSQTDAMALRTDTPRPETTP